MAAVSETPAPTATPRPRPGRQWSLAVLRGIATAHLVAVFAQPVFAGRFLIGDYDMLGLHAWGANAVSYLGLAQLVAALVLWWRGGPRWPSVVGAGLVLGETGQYFAGLARALDLHVPLGVALITASAIMLVGLWRPHTARRPGDLS